MLEEIDLCSDHRDIHVHIPVPASKTAPRALKDAIFQVCLLPYCPNWLLRAELYHTYGSSYVFEERLIRIARVAHHLTIMRMGLLAY